jgi:hypothetical protein
MKVLGSLGAGLAGVAIAMSAAAQTVGPEREPAIALGWDAPAECPTQDQVLSDVRSLAVHRGAAAPTKTIAVEAVVEKRAADRWSLTLAVGSAQQRLEASTCAQLARAAALFVALVLDPSSRERASAAPGEPAEESGPPVPAPVPALAPPTAAPMATHETAARPREVSVLAAAGLLIDVGTLPRAEPLAALEVGIRYRRAEITLQGGAGTAQDATTNGAAGAVLTPVSVTLTPCYAPLATSPFRLGPCALGEVGWIHAQGVDLSQAGPTSAAWFSLGGELVAWWAIGAHFEARLGAGVLIPVVRPNFEVAGYPLPGRGYGTGPNSLFEPGIALRAGTAAVVRF